MTILQALILGVVQGLTEFLPVSSSGHLIIIPTLFSWDTQPLVFDIILHFGTSLALIFYFRLELQAMLMSSVSDLKTYGLKYSNYGSYTRLLIALVLTTIPAIILGVLFSDIIEEVFRETVYVALFLLIGTVLLILAQIVAKAKSSSITSILDSFPTKKTVVTKSLALGLFQSLALLPGFSRSGSSISGGLILGFDYATSAKISFLMSLPIILLSGLYKIPNSINELTNFPVEVLFAGFFASFVAGLAAVSILTSFLKSRNLTVFIVYRLVLVGFLLLFTI